MPKKGKLIKEKKYEHSKQGKVYFEKGIFGDKDIDDYMIDRVKKTKQPKK